MINQLFVYHLGAISIGLRPEGSGGTQKMFDHEGVSIWLGNYQTFGNTVRTKYATIKLPATEDRPVVEVVASDYWDELYKLDRSTEFTDDQKAEMIREIAWKAIKGHFDKLGGGEILASLYEIWSGTRREGVKTGRSQIAGEFQALLDEA